jgi:hypothetical protein
MELQHTTIHKFTDLRYCEKTDLGLMLQFIQIAALNGISK